MGRKLFLRQSSIIIVITVLALGLFVSFVSCGNEGGADVKGQQEKEDKQSNLI